MRGGMSRVGGGERGYLGSPAKTGFFRSGWLEGFKTIGGRRDLPIPKTYFPAPLVSVLPCVPAARVMSGWITSSRYWHFSHNRACALIASNQNGIWNTVTEKFALFELL